LVWRPLKGTLDLDTYTPKFTRFGTDSSACKFTGSHTDVLYMSRRTNQTQEFTLWLYEPKNVKCTLSYQFSYCIHACAHLPFISTLIFNTEVLKSRAISLLIWNQWCCWKEIKLRSEWVDKFPNSLIVRWWPLKKTEYLNVWDNCYFITTRLYLIFIHCLRFIHYVFEVSFHSVFRWLVFITIYWYTSVLGLAYKFGMSYLNFVYRFLLLSLLSEIKQQNYWAVRLRDYTAYNTGRAVMILPFVFKLYTIKFQHYHDI
jgi:hypothetical protein